MRKDEDKLLELEIKLLEDANKMLVYSYDVCREIGIKPNYTFEELDRFEALTSRFARTSDILIQKIFRLIDILELEGLGTVIDRINRAEGRNLINSAEVFKKIRRLTSNVEFSHPL